MKPFLSLLVALFFVCHISAQPDSLQWEKEINRQVWHPFITYLTSNNQDSLKNLHSRDIARVEIDRNIIKDMDMYFGNTKKYTSQPGTKRLFELRFDKRICNGTLAWETGYYKGTVLAEGKAPHHYYGRFYVVLRKEEGTWKILVDADTGKDASEENFSKAAAIQ